MCNTFKNYSRLLDLFAAVVTLSDSSQSDPLGFEDQFDRQYFCLLAPSKGCCLNPKGWCMDTPYHSVSTPWKIQLCLLFVFVCSLLLLLLLLLLLVVVVVVVVAAGVVVVWLMAVISEAHEVFCFTGICQGKWRLIIFNETLSTG